MVGLTQGAVKSQGTKKLTGQVEVERTNQNG